jgi:hypothetical protein
MDQLISRKASEIKAEPISWLVPDVFPSKALSIIFGMPGLGKSQISLDLAAAVSRGSKFANHVRATRGNVIVMNVDDDPARQIKPRLLAAGADLSRVHVVEGVQGEKGKEVFNLAKHFDALRRKVQEVKSVKLCIIDPIYPNAAGRAGDTANALRNFAEEHNTAVLAIMHPKKAKGGADIHKIAGSQVWGAATRAAWAVDKGQLFPVKLSYAAPNTAFSFGIEPETIKERDATIKTSKVHFWSVDPYEAQPVVKEGQIEKAIAMLTDILGRGEASQMDARTALNNAGISNSTIERAKEKLGVVTRRGKGEQRRMSFWSLPKEGD